MKQIYTLLLLLFVVAFNQAQIINIPDFAFKNVLLNDNVADFDGDNIYDGDVDINNDGEIQEQEALQVVKLKINNKNIYNLTGLEKFLNLEELNCSNNFFSSIDLSLMSQLKVLHCNEISTSLSLDVTANNNLELLSCYGGQVVNLAIGQKTLLKSINCYANQLISIDVTLVPNLEILICGGQDLSSNGIDISQNTNLKVLECSLASMASINVNQNALLEELYCNDNMFSNLNLDQNIALKKLSCFSNQLQSLNLSQNVLLEDLQCDNNQLEWINIKNTSIESVLTFDNNSTLNYICADTAQVASIQNQVSNYGYASCSVGDDCVILSTPDYPLDTSLEFFPNPIKNSLTIKGSNNLKSIAVYDVNSRLLKEVSLVGNQLEKTVFLSELEAGMYLVKIVSSKGQLVEQLVKE